MSRTKTRRTVAGVTGAVVASLALVACGGESGESGGGAGASEFGLSINDDNQIVQDELTTLSTGACKAENDALPLAISTMPISDVDQKVQLLASQDALPAQFAAGGTPALTKQLDEAGQVVDLEATLKDLGVWENVQPAAITTVENLYGGFKVMPYQFNIEGIWFNKTMFADLGIAQPTTFDELLAAADTIKAAGFTPFSASGDAGWPITRLISGYLYRDLGPDAMQAVADGTAELTDPEYVEAAQAIADMGAKGYFGEGVGSIDYDTAVQQFVTGKAGMFYMGSWELGTFNDETKNQIGADAVGYMSFPEVAGGSGSADQIPANVGLPIAVSKKDYNDQVGDWLTCIGENYGTGSLKDQGTISGFKPTTDPGPLPALTQQVQDTIDSTTTSVLWFEALFNTKATDTSQKGAASLVTGQLTPDAFMASVQADLDAG